MTQSREVVENPPPRMTGTLISCIVNTMAADDMATQGARASAAIIPSLARKYILHTCSQYNGCWYHSDARSPGINSHEIGLSLPDYSRLSTKVYPAYMFSTMAADIIATQGARASTAMALVYLSLIIPGLARKYILHTCSVQWLLIS